MAFIIRILPQQWQNKWLERVGVRPHLCSHQREKINKLFGCLWHIVFHYFNNCLLFVYVKSVNFCSFSHSLLISLFFAFDSVFESQYTVSAYFDTCIWKVFIATFVDNAHFARSLTRSLFITFITTVTAFECLAASTKINYTKSLSHYQQIRIYLRIVVKFNWTKFWFNWIRQDFKMKKKTTDKTTICQLNTWF